MDLSVTPDFRNNTQHVIDLDQASLGMPDRSYLLRGLNDSAVAGYYKLMVESAVMLGANRERAEKEMIEGDHHHTYISYSFSSLTLTFSLHVFLSIVGHINFFLLSQLFTALRFEMILANVSNLIFQNSSSH